MWIEKDNKEDPYNRQNGTPQPASVGSGSGSGAPVGAGEGNQTNVTPAGTSSTTQVPEQKQATVQDYLGANKVQGNQLGQQFQSKLNDVGAKDTKTIDDAASNVKSQAAAGSTTYDPNTVNAAFNDPTKTANDPDKLQSFLKQWNASYTGPSSFEASTDYNAANSAATDAKTHSTEVADAGGRKQLLQDDFGVYGQGNKGLDHTLLQNSDNFGQVLDTGKSLSSIPDYLKSKATDVNAVTSKAATDTAAAQKNTQDLFAPSFKNFATDINNKVSSTQSPLVSLKDTLQKDLGSGDTGKVLTDLNKAGVNAPDAQNIVEYLKNLNEQYNVTPTASGNFLSNPLTDVTASNVASKDDYAKAAALQKLTGVDYTGVLDPANAAKAGTAPNSLVKSADLSSYLKNTLNQHDSELLREPSLESVFSKLNTPNILDATKAGNPADGAHVAQALIDATKRMGNSGDTIKSLAQYQKQAEDQYKFLMLNAPYNGPAGGKENTLAGLSTFIRMLSGTTGVASSIGSPIAPPPSTPVKPGNGTVSVGGTTYTDPKTGQTKVAY